MHSLELLEQALDAARSLGYDIRQEYLGGVGGGACEFGGKKWIFVDLALPVGEQLDEVIQALCEDPAMPSLNVRGNLANLLGLRRAA